ncbi:putative alpha-ketoglutarate-dependent dioxygenase ABH6 protein, partial [Naja naja]
MERNNFVNRH